MTNSNGPRVAFPPDVTRELEANYLRISAPLSAQLLWDGVLTPSDRVVLGNDLKEAYAQGGTLGMWKRLRGVSDARAIIDVARELNLIDGLTERRLLGRTGEFSEDPEEALQQALQKADLILTDQPRAVYWHGKAIPIDWDRRPALWNFLWELCCRAKSGRGVDYLDFPGDRKPSYPAKTKSRLTNLSGFPQNLADLIEPTGHHAQRLRLAPERIRILRTDPREVCREEFGRAGA